MIYEEGAAEGCSNASVSTSGAHLISLHFACARYEVIAVIIILDFLYSLCPGHLGKICCFHSRFLLLALRKPYKVAKLLRG